MGQSGRINEEAHLAEQVQNKSGTIPYTDRETNQTRGALYRGEPIRCEEIRGGEPIRCEEIKGGEPIRRGPLGIPPGRASPKQNASQPRKQAGEPARRKERNVAVSQSDSIGQT